MGLISLKPGRASAAGLPARVTVSPTRASVRVLMLAHRKPASPGPKEAISTGPGEKAPRRMTSNSAPLDIMRMRWPSFTVPSMTRNSTTTPW
ncbi:hypothetical protein DSECCO2_590300 [anaerobic digester metagenome]